MELKAAKSNVPLGAIIVAKLAQNDIKVTWDKVTEMNIGENVVLKTCPSIARYLARTNPGLNLYGGDNIDLNTEVDHWLTFSLGPLSCQGEFKNALTYFERVLAPLTFLVGDSVTIADYVVFGTLFGSGFWQGFMQSGKEFQNVTRWYKFIASRPEVESVIQSLPKDTLVKAVKYEEVKKEKPDHKPQKLTKGQNAEKQTKDEGKFVDLPNAEMGKVIVRFPPEASGYLHVGHAKAALLNQHYQQVIYVKIDWSQFG